MEEIHVPLENIFSALIERTNNICLAFHVQHRKFVYLNPALEFFLGLIHENINAEINLLLKSIHRDDVEYAVENYNKVLENGSVEGVVLRFILNENKLKTLKLEAWLLNIDGVEYIAGIADDITGESEQLLILNRFAEKKNSILEILSHDLTGPLGNIQMCAALLQSQINNFDAGFVASILDKIINNSERSLKLIREFLKKEFLETFEAALVKVRVDIVERIHNFIEEFKKAGPELDKKIIVVAYTQPVYVHIDEPKFIQVLQNLLSNAMKFTHAGGTIKIEIADKDPDVLIMVEDNGIGIPADLQKDIFQKFSKAGRPGLKGEKSVGLGMSIIKQIIDWHNGKIWFMSEENKGTTFFIQIPKQPAGN